MSSLLVRRSCGIEDAGHTPSNHGFGRMHDATLGLHRAVIHCGGGHRVTTWQQLQGDNKTCSWDMKRGPVQAVHAVADALERHKVTCCVVDPVLVATSGHSLADTDVAAALGDR